MAAATGLKRDRFYGWTALAGAMLAYFSCCGTIFYSYGVFLPSISETFPWSRAELSGPFSLFVVLMGLLGPLAGASVTKFGARKNIIFGNLVMVLGLAGMFLIKDIWQVYLFYGVLVGVGFAFGMFLPLTTIANDWFIKRRSLAMSLLLTSGAIGGFAFPPLVTWLISSLGWQLAWVYLAIIHLVLAVGIAGMLIKNKPEDIGQVPDGEVARDVQEVQASRPALSRIYQTSVDWTAREALRTRAFWMILVFAVANDFLLNTLVAHQVIYLRHLDFPPMVAASALSMFVGLSIVGRLSVGASGSRVEGRYLAAACLGVFAIGVIILMNVKALPFIYLYVYALLSGAGYGGLLVVGPAMFGAYYGRANYAQILGWHMPLVTLLGAAGPLLAGLSYDIAGSYIPAFAVAVALLGVGLVCALLAKPPKPRITIPR